ncbi:hypothetical protein [Steroidobacter cummioxidans]|uniref:hypothetical protein n=1 Tax=Steroidobacter cummioxidans TaxID=1803913 RepID=UPI000E30F6E7|nr:hypothetical protein [Steroidobacter cummioxidans]
MATAKRLNNSPMRVLRACTLAAVLAVSGCASSQAAVSDQPEVEAEQSFEASLRKCRRLQPGRLNQRMNLPPTSLRVSQCLSKLGWQPDGTRYAPAASETT